MPRESKLQRCAAAYGQGHERRRCREIARPGTSLCEKHHAATPVLRGTLVIRTPAGGAIGVHFPASKKITLAEGLRHLFRLTKGMVDLEALAREVEAE